MKDETLLDETLVIFGIELICAPKSTVLRFAFVLNAKPAMHCNDCSSTCSKFKHPLKVEESIEDSFGKLALLRLQLPLSTPF